MKKFVFFLLIAFVVFSCSVDDSEPKYEPISLPIESVAIADNWVLNEEGLITITYRRPTTCHFFNGFNYQYTTEFTRTVGIEAIKLNENNCEDASLETYDVDLKFKPTKIGVYHFRFWSGVDENDNYTFLEYDVDVQ